MTTDADLTERIRAAMHEADPDLLPCEQSRAAAVLPTIRAAQAEAWDKGENAGFLHGRWDEYTINPYREERSHD